MKRMIALLLSALTLLFCSPSVVARASVAQVTEQDSKTVLYRDFLLTMLMPYINQAIKEHYHGEGRQWALYEAQIRDIKRLCNKGQFYFQTTVMVETWTGAHNPPYGLETLTLVNGPGEPRIRVIAYSHRDISGKTLPIRRNC